MFLFSTISQSLLTAALVYSTHYTSVKLYNTICIPDGIWGYFGGMATTASPLCSSLCDIMSASQITYCSVICMSISNAIVAFIHKQKPSSPSNSEDNT